MKRVIQVLLVSVVVGGAATAAATEVGNGRNFGLGFQVGDPTALIGKVFVGGENAIDFGLGFGSYGYERCWDGARRRYYDCRGGYGRLSIHADYLWQQTLVRRSAQLDWHIGVGGRMVIWDDDALGDDDDIWLAARMPLGLDLSFDRPGFLEVFFEIAPAFYVFPFLEFDLDAAIGVRFYF